MTSHLTAEDLSFFATLPEACQKYGAEASCDVSSPAFSN